MSSYGLTVGFTVSRCGRRLFSPKPWHSFRGQRSFLHWEDLNWRPIEDSKDIDFYISWHIDCDDCFQINQVNPSKGQAKQMKPNDMMYSDHCWLISQNRFWTLVKDDSVISTVTFWGTLSLVWPRPPSMCSATTWHPSFKSFFGEDLSGWFRLLRCPRKLVNG